MCRARTSAWRRGAGVPVIAGGAVLRGAAIETHAVVVATTHGCQSGASSSVRSVTMVISSVPRNVRGCGSLTRVGTPPADGMR